MTFTQPTSFNLRGLSIPEQPTLRMMVPDAPIAIPDRPTARLRAVTRPLHDLTTQELPVVTAPLAAFSETQELPALDDEDKTDKRQAIRPPLLCQIEDFARADGVTPYGMIARLLDAERRRRIARDVEDMLT